MSPLKTGIPLIQYSPVEVNTPAPLSLPQFLGTVALRADIRVIAVVVIAHCSHMSE
jgi:hypothetical protein